MPQTNEQRKGNWATDPEAAAKMKIIRNGMPTTIADLENEARIRSMRTGCQRRDPGWMEYQGQRCPVLWSRGGTVCIEVAEGIRKQVVE